MMFILILIVGALATFMLYSWREYCKFIKLYQVIEKIPGPKARWLVGNALDFSKDPVSLTLTMEKWILEFRAKSSIFRFWLCHKPYVVLLSAEANQAVLKSTTLIDKSKDYCDILKQWMGDGLLISSGDKWKLRRKMITKSFHFSILDTFIHVMHEKAQILVNTLKVKATDGKAIDLAPYICKTSLDIICETAMGVDVKALTSTENLTYLNAVKNLTKMIVKQYRSPWYWIKLIFYLFGGGGSFYRSCRIVHNFSRKVIRDRKQVLMNHSLEKNRSTSSSTDHNNEGDIKHNQMSFLDNLLAVQQENNLTESDIWEEVETFMFEGHDTTSSGIIWTMFALGNHPKIQQRVFEEVIDVLGTSLDCPTSEQLKKMLYLRAVIKETLRLWTTVPLFSRRVNKSFMLEGYDIPKETTLVIIPFAVQTDEKYYGPSVLDFDPDRFLDDKVDEFFRHPFSFVAFSAGQRNCIGQKFALQEMTIVIASIIRSYRVHCLTHLKDIINVTQLVNKPSKPIATVLIPRN